VGDNCSIPNGWEIVGGIVFYVTVGINGEPAQAIFVKAHGVLDAWSKSSAKRPSIGGRERRAKKCENASAGRGNGTSLD
jgi:hypothetical protein